MNKINVVRCAFWYMLVFIVFQGYSQWTYLGGPDIKLSDGLRAAITSLYVTNCEVFAGTECGLYKSTDGCKTWTRTDAIDSNLKVVDIVRNGTVFFAGTDAGGIYCSDDDGVTWRKTGAFDSTCCMAVNDSFIIAGNTRGMQICRIDDSVWTWVDADNIPSGTLSIDAKDSIVVAGGYDSCVYRSNNFGTEWNAITCSGLPSSKISSVAVSGEIVFATVPSSGVYCIVNCGTNWAKIADSTSTMYGDVVVIDNAVFFATKEGIFSTDFFGTKWHSVSTGMENKTVATFFLSAGSLYAGTEHDGIWYTQISDLYAPVIRVFDNSRSIIKIDFKMQHLSNSDHNSVIKFVIPESMQVKVTLYDISGHVIRIPVSGYFKEGIYNFTLNDDKIAHGFYIAKMNAGGSVITTRYAIH